MEISALVEVLNHLKVETCSLACLGCGHEHDCSTKGCALIRAAADLLQDLGTIQAKKSMVTDDPQGILPRALNLFYLDEHGWACTRAAAVPMRLQTFARYIADTLHLDIDFESMSDQDINDYMYELLYEPMDSAEYILALMYEMGWASCELRERLRQYENLGKQVRPNEESTD